MCDSWYQLIPRAAGKRYWNIIVMTCMCVLNSFRETKWRIVWRSERLEKHTKKMNRFLPFDGKSQRPHSLSLAWQPRAFKVDFIDMKWNGARRWRHRAAINRFQGRKKGKKKSGLHGNGWRMETRWPWISGRLPNQKKKILLPDANHRRHAIKIHYAFCHYLNRIHVRFLVYRYLIPPSYHIGFYNTHTHTHETDFYNCTNKSKYTT